MNQDYLCQYFGHERESILGFCLNLQCQDKSQWCVLCLKDKQKHKEHDHQCQSFNQIHDSIQFFQSLAKGWLEKVKAEFEKVQKEYHALSKFLQSQIFKMIELQNSLQNHQYQQFRQDLVNLKKWNSISKTQINSDNLISISLKYLDLISQLNKQMDILKNTKVDDPQVQEQLKNIQVLDKFNNEGQPCQTYQIEVYFCSEQNFTLFSTEKNKNLYSEIRQFLSESQIVIFHNDQLCPEYDTFADILEKAGDKQIILFVFTIPEILNQREEIDRLTQIEVKEQQQENDIIELQNSVAQLQNQIQQEIIRSIEMGLKEYQYQNQIKKLEEQVKELKDQMDKKEQPLPYNKSRSFEKTKKDFIVIDDQRKIVAHEYIFQLIKNKSQELESLEQSYLQVM